MKKFTFITVLYFLLHFPAILFAATYYVDTSGSDSGGNGSKEKPWRSVSYALNEVQSGDIVSINDGTFHEGAISVPPGVSLTSTSSDKNKVVLKPNVSLKRYNPWIRLESSSPGSNGNQTISHLSFYGVNGDNRVTFAIRIQNRSNVRIHHCNFTDFKDSSVTNASEPGWDLARIESTEISSSSKWWDVWPKDPGELGDDTSIDAIWPANPVEKFEFDNNTITSCYVIRLFNLKDSSIHDNVIDNSATYEWTIRGTPAILDDVDIYNNTLLANPHGTEYGDPTNAIFTMELWVWRRGCQVYNNTTNAFFSLTVGKQTKVYNNILSPVAGGDIVERPNIGIGLELTGQSYLEAYGNYVANNHTRGIGVGHDTYSGNGTVRGITVRNNVIVAGTEKAYTGILVGCKGLKAGHTPTVTGVNVFNNVVYGNNYNQGIKVASVLNNSISATLKNVSIKNNIMMNIGGYAGKIEKDGTITNLVIDNNLSYGCTKNGWYDAWVDGSFSVSKQIVSDPLFVGPTINYAGFALDAGSPAIDAGVAVGLPYYGAALDIGAIEVDENIMTSKPEAPASLSIFFD